MQHLKKIHLFECLFSSSRSCFFQLGSWPPNWMAPYYSRPWYRCQNFSPLHSKFVALTFQICRTHLIRAMYSFIDCCMACCMVRGLYTKYLLRLLTITIALGFSSASPMNEVDENLPVLLYLASTYWRSSIFSVGRHLVIWVHIRG